MRARALSKWSVGAASLALGLALSSPAFAFCRTRTCQPKKENCPPRDPTQPRLGCTDSGKELFRKSSCVSFNVQELGSPRRGIDGERFEQIVRDAFDRWLNADCGGGAHPSIAAESLGTVSCNEVQYNCTHGNANIFLFEDENWTATDAADAYALTTVWFVPSSGEIRDVDVEINGTQSQLDWDNPRDGVNLPSIVTHEVGHFLGLAHSPEDASAVMRWQYDYQSDDLRTLTADDIAGICAIYPPDRAVSSDDCSPRNGLASDCGPGDGTHCAASSSSSGCCSTAPGRPEPLAVLALSAFASASVIARGRRKKRNSG
jgi:hypothetical protein